MAVHVLSIETLITKAKFEPHVALAVVEAMDQTMQETQLVTVPVLDSRLGDLRRDVDIRFAQLKSDLTRWVFVTALGQILTLATIVHFMLQSAAVSK